MTIFLLVIMVTLCAVFYRIGLSVGWRRGWNAVLNFISEGYED